MSHATIQIDAENKPIGSGGHMRAGVYRGKGRVVVESVPVPEIGEGEVLFRVAACGICGTDIKKIEHGYVAPPQILGHELAGTVVKVGAGVKKFKAGDRVMSFHHVPCGACFYCERKLFSQCAGYKKTGLTAGFDPNGGGFAEYVRAMPWVVERGMIALPPDVTFEDATFIEPVNTCLKAVRKARVAPWRNCAGDRAGAHRNAADAPGEVRGRRSFHERPDGRAAAPRACALAPPNPSIPRAQICWTRCVAALPGAGRTPSWWRCPTRH